MKNTKPIVFAGGCFWCTEAIFRSVKGVKDIVPGYTGGTKINPTYEEVCSGSTHHAESVKITYDSKVVSLNTLLNIFFSTHNPTTNNQQGADAGTQYRSAIFYTNMWQKNKAEEFINNINRQKIYDKKIVTTVTKLKDFYEAEKYHKNYYEKNKNAYYCKFVINPKLKFLKKEFKKHLRLKR